MYNFLFKSNEPGLEGEQDYGSIKARCIINPKGTKPMLAAVMKRFFVPLVKTSVNTLAGKSPMEAAEYLNQFITRD